MKEHSVLDNPTNILFVWDKPYMQTATTPA
jgi:hypothetical protein